MHSLSVEIPNARAGTYRLISFIITALNFFLFGYIFIRAGDLNSQLAAIAGLLVNAVPAIYFLLTKKILRTPFTEISFFITAMLWLLWHNYPAAILMILFSLLNFAANKKLLLTFDESGVTVPSFPVKKYSWAEVEQVLLKDDILTVDLRNNKLMQFRLDKTLADIPEAIHFNRQIGFFISKKRVTAGPC